MGALGNGTFGRDPLYEASKNCVRVMLEGMMSSLRSQGIQLTIVSPGRIAVRLIVRFLEDTYDRRESRRFWRWSLRSWRSAFMRVSHRRSPSLATRTWYTF